MANLVLFASNRYTGDTSWAVHYYGAQTATRFELLDDNGILRQSSIGVGFTYGSGGFFNSGTITSEFFFSTDGQLTAQRTGMNVDVATRNSLVTPGESVYDYSQYVYRGNDSLLGSSGDDRLYGSKGSDTINGGAGSDVLSFNGYSEGVTVNLATGKAVTSSGTSNLSNIEDIAGSTRNDTLVGNSGNNQIQGFDGADIINGGAGFDTAVYFDADSAISVNLATGKASGGGGNDTLASIERVLGSRFNDTLAGSKANETFLGGFGNDTIDGGGGVDTVEYGYVGAGVAVSLATGKASGGAGNDTFRNVENIKGSIFNDTLTGNSGANAISGGNGSDTLGGGAGNDTLNGGADADRISGGLGKDTLTGGSGADSFKFAAVEDSGTTAALRDVVADFNAGQGDKIDLSAIDANTRVAGNQAFASLSQGGAFSGHFASPGDLYFDQAGHVLHGNNDADSAADFSIQLAGVGSLSLSALVL